MTLNKISLRWYEGKQLLAFLRSGDYAHPGETDAINLVFAPLAKDQNRTVLDVGCGLGGTAKFIQDCGWGKVTGADVDEAAIAYAQKTYPDVEFCVADVLAMPQILSGRTFDIICLFNSFYAFPQQLQALMALRQFAHVNTQLIIFEYADLTHGHNPFTVLNDPRRFFLAIQPEQIAAMLTQANWHLAKTQMITEEYEKWYDTFVKKIIASRHEVIAKFGDEKYQAAVTRYSKMLAAIRNGQLGGCIVTAMSN